MVNHPLPKEEEEEGYRSSRVTTPIYRGNFIISFGTRISLTRRCEQLEGRRIQRRIRRAKRVARKIPYVMITPNIKLFYIKWCIYLCIILNKSIFISPIYSLHPSIFPFYFSHKEAQLKVKGTRIRSLPDSLSKSPFDSHWFLYCKEVCGQAHICEK